jgi:hypothetical protein
MQAAVEVYVKTIAKKNCVCVNIKGVGAGGGDEGGGKVAESF